MKDVDALIRGLRRDGWAVTRARRSGHWHVRDGSGRLVAVIASTPSDWRGLKNLRSRLRQERGAA